MDKRLALAIRFNALDKLSGSMKNIIGLGKSGTQELAGLKREARELDKQLQDVRGRLASGSMQGGLVMAERELVKAMATTNRELEKRQRFIQIDNKVARMHAQGDSLQAAGQSNMMQGAGMMAPIILSAREAMQFSSGMVDLQQKANLTNGEMIRMRGNILSVARATYQLPENMRAAVDVLSGFGMDPRDAVKLATPIGQLGTAFKVELADGAAAAYANINNLKLAASETGKAFDIMAAGGNAGAFEIKDMAKWFPSLTAQASRVLPQSRTSPPRCRSPAAQPDRRTRPPPMWAT